MIGSIERVRRHISFRPVLPLLVLVIAWRNPKDPSRKVTGYGGVLPVPAPTAPTQPTSASARPDSILEQQHRDQRAARGRVLYAAGRPPQTTTAQRTDGPKPPCDARVGPTRAASSAPNT